MIYTKFFSQLINEYGRPNLTEAQFRKLMNIVHLEGRLKELNSIKRKLEGTREAHRFDIEYFKVNKLLVDLTGNLSPQQLKKELFSN